MAAKENQTKPKGRFGRRGLLALGGTVVAAAAARHTWLRLARAAPPDGPLSAPARELIAQAWNGLVPAKVLDCHVHILGLGVGGTGCYVNPTMRSLAHPVSYGRFDLYRRAAGIEDLERADEQYLQTLLSLIRQTDPHGRVLALAFDRAYREDGSIDEKGTSFYVPNDYVLSLAAKHPTMLVACGSVHPYRKDALEALQDVAARGAKAIKWLPSAMGIDPASSRCTAYYRKLAELGLPLLSHAGTEKAVEADATQEFANPLRLRHALDAGVKVIVAHCASSGEGLDMDATGRDKPRVANFDLFLRMMDEPQYRERLFGDVSATTQYNRCHHLEPLLRRQDLHARLINGSDYPLPGLNVLARTGSLVELGLLDEPKRALLNEIDRHNPLLFDFVMKRTLRGQGGTRFGDTVFMPPDGLFPA